MAVLTRSRAAAQRSLNPTRPNADTVDARINTNETAVQGAAGNRKIPRSRKAKSNGTRTPANITEDGNSASTASHSVARSSSRTISRRGSDNERHVSQPRDTTTTISQKCGLYVTFTFQQVEMTSNAAGGSSQPLPISPPEANGAGTKGPRRGRRTTTRRGPKAEGKAGRTGQQKVETNSTVRAGTKRRREDDEYQPGDSSDEETVSASTRILRRVRRKTEKVSAAAAPSHCDVGEAVNRTRLNKGKARMVDVPTTEEASAGSKRLRDEEDADTGDVSQQPLDPGPSRRTKRRTRRRVDVQIAEETEKKVIRGPRSRGRRTNVPARSHLTVSQVSTPLSCESEEPTFVPSPAPSIERRKAEERPESQGVQPGVGVKQEEVPPLFFPYQQVTGPPVEDAIYKTESSVLLSPLMLPDPFIPATAVCPYADASSNMVRSTVKVDEPPSPSLGHDILPSPGGSDKETDPMALQLTPRGRPAKSEDIAPLFFDTPMTPGDDGYAAASDAGSDEDGWRTEDDDEDLSYSVVRSYPRRSLEPMQAIASRASEPEESAEPEAASSDKPEHTAHEVVASRHSASGEEVCSEAEQREGSPPPRDVDSANNDDTGLASGCLSPCQLPDEVPERLGDSQRKQSGKVEESLEVPISPNSTVTPDNLDRGTLRERESLLSPVPKLDRKPETPSSEADANERSKCLDEDAFVRSDAPSPSPSLPGQVLAGYPTLERAPSLPLCQCGNIARHFVVHSDGEASEFSFMGDDEDF